MEKAELDAIVALVNTLPTLPDRSVKVLAMVEDPRSRQEEIAAAIAVDPALTARVLRLVNSAFYGLRREVTTVQQGIAYLGLNTIKNLLLTASIFDSIGVDRARKEAYGGLLRHSIATAFAADLVCGELGIRDDGECFTLGILHDLGRLVLLEHLPETYERIIALVAERDIRVAEAEMETIGTDHAEIAERLFARWKLPPALCAGVRWHHAPERAPLGQRRNTAVLALADHLARAAGIGAVIGPVPGHFPASIQQILLADAALAETVTAALVRRTAEIDEYLHCLEK